MNRLIVALMWTASSALATPSPDGGTAAAPDSAGAALIKSAPGTVVFRGSAPAGSRISLGGSEFPVDSAGAWTASLPLDSAARSSRLELCLVDGARRACTSVSAGAYDTLDLAPLAFTADTAASAGPEYFSGAFGTDTVPASPGAGASTAAAAMAASATVVDGGRENSGRTVNVKARRRPARAAGQSHVSAKEIKRLPGLAEPDVIRAVQALPGVVASSDFSTKLYVRGSASDQNLILFDNAIVYSPMHFGGIFSTFLADAVGGMDFYKGGFDSRYGDRLSSVLSVTSKDGGATDTGAARETWAQGTARVTTLSGSLETDGRKGNWSWVGAGRRTWIDEALSAGRALGVTSLSLPYYFYDAQGSVAYGKGGDTLRVSAYQGQDDLTLDPINITWGNTAIPVNLKLRLGERWEYSGTMAYSRFSQKWKFGDIQSLSNSMEDWNARQELSLNAGAGHLLTMGGEYNHFRAAIGQESSNVDTQDKTSTDLYAGYLQDRWVLSPQHSLTVGLRGYLYPELNDMSWDPRATYTWRPTRDWRLDAHAGIYHQYLTSIRWTDQETFNEFWYPAKGSIKPSHSTLLSLGAERSDLTSLHLKVSLEGYYKDIRDLPLYFPYRTQAEIQASGSQISDDFTTQDGYAAGTELTVAREEGALSGEASWGVSQAVLRQKDYTNSLGTHSFEAYAADWDQRNTVKAKLNLNWRGKPENSFWNSGKRGLFLRTTLQANYHTGLPYTQFEDYYSVHEPDQGADGGDGAGPATYLKDNTYLRQGRHNGTVRKDYFRLDATVFDWGREGKWRLYWTILNLTDRQNVFLINFDTSKNPPQKQETYQIPLLPILVGYEYQF